MDNSRKWAATKYREGGAVTASDPQYGAISYHNEPKDPPRYGAGGAIKGYASAGKVTKAVKEGAKKALSKSVDEASSGEKLFAEELAAKLAKEKEAAKKWKEEKNYLESTYGELMSLPVTQPKAKRMRNTKQAVQERIDRAKEFLSQPTEPWTPPPAELQAFPRSDIKEALEGFPDVEQSRFPRDIPARADVSYVEDLYTDPVNRELIKQQIIRGLPLGGETFYASLYPVKKAVLEAGGTAEDFTKWVHSIAPASARNSILNEMAVGQFLRDLNAKGIELTEENVNKAMQAFKEENKIGLPLMPTHREGVKDVLGGIDLREHSLANIPTNYKIPTYGTQKAGDFAKSVVLDVHEAGGETLGSQYHPYFNEAGGFKPNEYGAGEAGMLSIAEELGIPGGMAQAGRWFGGGELTGLRSPRGDALDLLEKQVAYTLQQRGIQPNPANIREEIIRQIMTGEGTLLPYFKKEALPDVRVKGLQRAEGGEVHMADGGEVRSFGLGGSAKLEDDFKKADTIDMTGFRRDPMEEAVQKAVSRPKKENPYLGVGRRLKKLASLPVEIGKELGKAGAESVAKDVSHLFNSPTGGRDFIKNLASDLAGQLEESQPAYSMYRAMKGEKPIRQRILGDTEDMLGLTMLTEAGVPMAGSGLKKLAPEIAKTVERTMVDPYKFNVIKPEGGQWITKRLEKELEGIAMPDTNAELNKAINGWIRGPLRKYIMNRMGTESDELTRLYDAGIYHKPPQSITGYPATLEEEEFPAYMDKIRSQYPSGKTTAKTPEGFKWEMSSDLALRPRTAREIKDSPMLSEQAPWIDKLDPNETVYGLYSRGYEGDTLRSLGFDHIVDVLKNDIREGKLRPEQLNKVSIEDAAKRTHQYNQEMAKKAEETIARQDEFLPKHREYPEGYKWVELKHKEPEGYIPEGFQVDEVDYGNGEKRYFAQTPNGRSHAYKTREEAQADLDSSVKELRGFREKNKTQEYLTYEGDSMGHCVGSYCEDVMSGDTRIFSLRDPQGKPHVTVEVKPTEGVKYSQMAEVLGEETVDKMLESGMTPRQIVDSHPELQKLRTYSIEQIKGKGNEKPADKYLPYVQDFVKNSPISSGWGKVRDFENTDLIDIRRMKEYGYLPDMDIKGSNEVLSELNRIYPMDVSPTGVKLFEGPHGRLIDNFNMLKREAEDLQGPYLTKEDILNHLRSREARPVEQSYSKYYENPEEPKMAVGGSAVAKGKKLIQGLIDEFSGATKIDTPKTIRTAEQKALPRNVAYNTYEQVPYAYSGHLEGMPEKSYLEKLDFTDEANWEKDGDLLAKYLGMKAEPSQRGVGLYTPPEEGAKLEMNPQISTRTRVSTDQQKRWRNEMTQKSQGDMSAMGATRGYFDVQGASPWVRPSEGGKRKYNSFHVVIDGKPTQEEMLKLGAIQDKYGFYGTSDLGKSGVFIGFNFDYGPKELKAMRKAFEADVKDALGNRVKGVKMVKSEGDYPSFEEEWKAQQGKGVATRKLMEYLEGAAEQNPLLKEFYAQRPSTELQKLMESMNIRDINAPSKYGVGAPRKDVLNAREIFAREGIEGLRKALEGGAYLPAVGVIGLEGLDDKR